MKTYTDITWKKDVMYSGGRKTEWTLKKDTEYPKLWRIWFPDGNVSDIYNKTRAKDNAAKLYLASTNRMGELASTEPAGAFKSSEGTLVPK